VQKACSVKSCDRQDRAVNDGSVEREREREREKGSDGKVLVPRRRMRSLGEGRKRGGRAGACIV
jgi:hypothetical protein